jgi:hypothetical protein
MLINSATLSTGTAGVDDRGFEMFMCYKNGLVARENDRKGMSCWAVGFHTAGVAAVKAYGISVYNYMRASDSVAVTTAEYAAENGGAATNGIENTTSGFKKSSGTPWT